MKGRYHETNIFMKNKNQKGFTLIELLIVIGIIAILAAAVIIAINPGQQFQQARNATRWSHMNSLANSTYSYVISEGGSYPNCTDGESTTTPLGNLIAFETEENARDVVECQTDLVGGGHMSELPRDPQVGVAGGNTGYLITFDGIRIKIMSAAAEAQENDIEVIQ
jgi:prepilin-type N-terminal cleavage/methylation domain-containing protein